MRAAIRTVTGGSVPASQSCGCLSRGRDRGPGPARGSRGRGARGADRGRGDPGRRPAVPPVPADGDRRFAGRRGTALGVAPRPARPASSRPPTSTCLRVAAAPPASDPLAVNLRARPELGLLVIDLRTRRRLRFNGRGLLVAGAASSCSRTRSTATVRSTSRSDASSARATAPAGRGARARRLSTGARAGPRGRRRHVLHRHLASRRRCRRFASRRPSRVRARARRADTRVPGLPRQQHVQHARQPRAAHPRAGLLFVDFARGDLLQLTGRVQVRWEPETAIVVAIEEARTTPGGSPLRYELVEPSPVNPLLAVTPLEPGGITRRWARWPA